MLTDKSTGIAICINDNAKIDLYINAIIIKIVVWL